MFTQRLPYVPYIYLGPGGVEGHMQGKKYLALKTHNYWHVISWENGEVICDIVTPEPRDNILEYLKETYG